MNDLFAGASAIQNVLNRNPNANVSAYAVWEPMLITDWKKPGSGVLGRITDARVIQIWDWKHMVAKQLAKDARAPQPVAECCTREGILWDLVAVYPPGAMWTDAMPPAELFNGAVVDMEGKLEAAIRKLQR